MNDTDMPARPDSSADDPFVFGGYAMDVPPDYDEMLKNPPPDLPVDAGLKETIFLPHAYYAVWREIRQLQRWHAGAVERVKQTIRVDPYGVADALVALNAAIENAVLPLARVLTAYLAQTHGTSDADAETSAIEEDDDDDESGLMPA